MFLTPDVLLIRGFMNFLRLYSTDPYHNLALEEYIFSKTQDSVFIIWQNSNTVVIGKNQNVFAEIDHDYLNEKKIAYFISIVFG